MLTFLLPKEDSRSSKKRGEEEGVLISLDPGSGEPWGLGIVQGLGNLAVSDALCWRLG